MEQSSGRALGRVNGDSCDSKRGGSCSTEQLHSTHPLTAWTWVRSDACLPELRGLALLALARFVRAGRLCAAVLCRQGGQGALGAETAWSAVTILCLPPCQQVLSLRQSTPFWGKAAPVRFELFPNKFLGLREHLYQCRGCSDAQCSDPAGRDRRGPRGEEGKYTTQLPLLQHPGLWLTFGPPALRHRDGQLLRSLPPLPQRQGQGQRCVCTLILPIP